MNKSARVPRLFIASSTESLSIAYAIQESLEYDAESTVWTQGIFEPSRQVLEQLIGKMRQSDFAVFVFSPDDVLKIRGGEYRVVRDNVLFEVGLFMGHLGPHACFLVAPRGNEELRLPSDLLGLSPLTFEPRRSDGNLIAALGTACNQIRRAMRAQSIPETQMSAEPRNHRETAAEKMERLVRLWDEEPLATDRRRLREGVPMSQSEDEDGAATEALTRVYAFLNAMAQTVVDAPSAEPLAKTAFSTAIESVWKHAFHYFAPLSAGTADDCWANDLPPIAVLAERWARQ